MIMRWCNVQTNEHDLQAKTYPNICTHHKLHNNNENKIMGNRDVIFKIELKLFEWWELVSVVLIMYALTPIWNIHRQKVSFLIVPSATKSKGLYLSRVVNIKKSDPDSCHVKGDICKCISLNCIHHIFILKNPWFSIQTSDVHIHTHTT